MNSTVETEKEEILNDNYIIHSMGLFYVISRSIIAVLGLVGNGLVIWITGFKIKKSVNSTWYLSLAMSDFLFCTTLPFYVAYSVQKYWIFGLFMCKFVLFFFYFNMFSSIFLLTVISVDRCVLVMFPVWVQNKRTTTKASVMVMIAWIISAALSMPGAFSQKYFAYTNSSYGDCSFEFSRFKGIFLCLFFFGFMIPFLVIVVCYVLIMRKLRTIQTVKTTKPFKVMTVIIAAFFICWLPYHTFNFIGLNIYRYDINKITNYYTGQIICSTLAYTNSFLNPFLYAFMGQDVKRACYSLLSNIESAIKEEDLNDAHGKSVKKCNKTLLVN